MRSMVEGVGVLAQRRVRAAPPSVSRSGCHLPASGEGRYAAIVNGSSPARRVRTGTWGTERGARPATAFAIAAIC